MRKDKIVLAFSVILLCLSIGYGAQPEMSSTKTSGSLYDEVTNTFFYLYF